MEGWISFHSWGDEPFTNGIHEVVYYQIHFSKSSIFIQKNRETVAIVDGWILFHSWGDDPFINGNPNFSACKLTFEKVENYVKV